MSGAFRLVGLGVATAAMLACQPSFAQDEAQDEAIVEAGSAQGASGRIAVNIVAGDANQQIGAANIALGEVAIAGLAAAQDQPFAHTGDRSTRISIGSEAFADMHGLVSLNVTAGQANQSANLAALAISTTGSGGALSDAALAQSRAPTKPNGGPGTGPATANDRIDVADDAFRGGSGVFQANLVGGERNSSANTFAVSVSGPGE